MAWNLKSGIIPNPNDTKIVNLQLLYKIYTRQEIIFLEENRMQRPLPLNFSMSPVAKWFTNGWSYFSKANLLWCIEESLIVTTW
jgi:hypothetical protein